MNHGNERANVVVRAARSPARGMKNHESKATKRRLPLYRRARKLSSSSFHRQLSLKAQSFGGRRTDYAVLCFESIVLFKLLNFTILQKPL